MTNHSQVGFSERIFMPERRIPDPSLLRSHPDARERVERLIDLKSASPGLTALLRGRTGFGIAPIFAGPAAALPHRGLWH